MELGMLQVERYKRIRPLFSGDFYPLTPCSLTEPWIGYQFHHIDLDKGFALLFKRHVTQDLIYPVTDTFELRLRGLKSNESYRVHFERENRDEIMTGEELACGIKIVISEEKGAEMVIYEAKI